MKTLLLISFMPFLFHTKSVNTTSEKFTGHDYRPTSAWIDHSNNEHIQNTVWTCIWHGETYETTNDYGDVNWTWFNNEQFSGTHHKYIKEYTCDRGDYSYQIIEYEPHDYSYGHPNHCGECGHWK